MVIELKSTRNGRYWQNGIWIKDSIGSSDGLHRALNETSAPAFRATDDNYILE
jgi:hypothetical protein